MKQLIFMALALPLLIVGCTKDASVQSTSRPSVINVTAMSTGMRTTGTSFTANETVLVSYTVAGADSIQWSMQDTIPYIPDSSYTNPWEDSVIHYPGGDTIIVYPDTFPHHPGDTIPTYPGGDTVVTYPGTDTLVTYPGTDSTNNYNNGRSYVLTVVNKAAEIRILKRGSYVLLANAYRRNANGTYMLINRGYVQLSAY